MKRFGRVTLGVIAAVGALAMVPGAVLAAQPSCGQVLTANTTLTGDLDCSSYLGTALYMGANGVVLNLNGHTLTGPAGTDSYMGVDTDSYNRTTIRNGEIADYNYAVYLDNSNRTTVSGLDIDGNDPGTAYGVYDYYGVSNVLNNLEVWDVYNGVYAEYSARTTIKNSDISASEYGVYLSSTAKADVSNNALHSDSYGVYDYTPWRNKYSGNTANGADYGFYMECNGNGPVTLTGNTANNTTTYGFYVYQCYEVDHPVIGYTGGTHVVGNTANNGDGYAFYDRYSYNEVWRNNVANDNGGTGFYWDYPSNALIMSNTARRNGGSGFFIEDNYQYYNVDDIAFNTARGNGDYGFYASYGAPSHDNVALNNSTAACYHVDCN